MRHIFGTCLTAAILALAAPAAAQDRRPPQEAEGQEIVVRGMKDRDRQVRDFVDALAKAPIGGQISRFEEEVCPAAIGLSPAQNLKVAARMRAVAAAVGIRVAKEGCSPNVSIIVAQDRDAMVKSIRAKWTDPLGDRVKVPNDGGKAVALHLEGRLDANGIPSAVQQETGDGRSGYYINEVADGSSRIRPSSRPHFLGSILVVEPAAIEGLTTTQLADYAAMRLLARTDPSRLASSAAPTILQILDAPMDSSVPLTLTSWDFGFLKALYGSGEGRYANQQRNEMQRLMTKELDKSQKGGGE
ncbi:MAG TPA: hypothetical protein VF662_04750 [Allosphingosinicella sp.]|jgi:hypothetical protein